MRWFIVADEKDFKTWKECGPADWTDTPQHDPGSCLSVKPFVYKNTLLV